MSVEVMASSGFVSGLVVCQARDSAELKIPHGEGDGM